MQTLNRRFKDRGAYFYAFMLMIILIYYYLCLSSQIADFL